MIRLHDTATATVRELALREPGKVSLYVCGPTVYGPPHLGHGRMTLVYDVLRRWLEWSGLEGFTRDRFEELTKVDAAVWRKEVQDHAELYDKLKSRMPQELYAQREALEKAL